MSEVNFKLKSNLDDIVDKIEGKSKERVEETVKDVFKRAQEKLKGQGSGRQYHLPSKSRSARTRRGEQETIKRVNPRGGKYRASRPGRPPAEATGLLRKTLGYYVEGSGSEFEGAVGSPLKEAVYLENGTGKMAPRRFLGPSYSPSKAKRIMSKRWF